MEPKRLSLVLPPRLAAALEQAVRDRETSVSEYVRDALRQRLVADRSGAPDVYRAVARGVAPEVGR